MASLSSLTSCLRVAACTFFAGISLRIFPIIKKQPQQVGVWRCVHFSEGKGTRGEAIKRILMLNSRILFPRPLYLRTFSSKKLVLRKIASLKSEKFTSNPAKSKSLFFWIERTYSLIPLLDYQFDWLEYFSNRKDKKPCLPHLVHQACPWKKYSSPSVSSSVDWPPMVSPITGKNPIKISATTK